MLLSSKMATSNYNGTREDHEHVKLKADVNRMEKEFLTVKAAFNKFVNEEVGH